MQIPAEVGKGRTLAQFFLEIYRETLLKKAVGGVRSVAVRDLVEQIVVYDDRAEGIDNVFSDDDDAAVGLVVSSLGDLTGQDVSPRSEKVLDEVFQPLGKVVELLAIIPFDVQSVFAGNPLTP